MYSTPLPRLFLPLLLAALFSLLPLLGRAVEPAGPTQAAREAGPEYLHALQRAGEAYARRDFPAALEGLDAAEQIHPEVPDTWSMRGAVYAEQRAYEKAEDAFTHAARLAPKGFWPRYNLAQLLFVEKKYGEAEAAFEKLLAGPGSQRELVQFKLVLLDLLQGKAGPAQKVLAAMKDPSDTVAYYFAHAAWEFAHDDQKQGKYWVMTGIKIFGLERSYPFYDALADVGWVKKRTAGGVPAPAMTLPMATPAVSP